MVALGGPGSFTDSHPAAGMIFSAPSLKIIRVFYGWISDFLSLARVLLTTISGRPMDAVGV